MITTLDPNEFHVYEESYDGDTEDENDNDEGCQVLLNRCDQLLEEMNDYIDTLLEEEDDNPIVARSPIPWECCGEIICICYDNPTPIDYESEELEQIPLIPIENNQAITIAYTYPLQELTRIYEENIQQKQVIANQPITQGGSRCTFECDTENHHLHTYCKLCKRNLPYGTNIHDCTIGIQLEQKHSDMNPEFLTTHPW